MIKDAIFHHIGYAVNDIDKAKKEFRDGGYELSETVLEPVQKVYVAYARREGFPTIELLQPSEDTSPIVTILTKNGPAPYHICYAVKNIQSAITELRGRKFLPLSRPLPGHGLDDALMVFMYKKNVGLIQLVEI